MSAAKNAGVVADGQNGLMVTPLGMVWYESERMYELSGDRCTYWRLGKNYDWTPPSNDPSSADAEGGRLERWVMPRRKKTEERNMIDDNDRLKPKYVICPGRVTSKTDGQTHYIGARVLMHLYGVDPQECEIYEPAAWWPESYYRMAEERQLGLTRLYPRYDGNYERHNEPK